MRQISIRSIVILFALSTSSFAAVTDIDGNVYNTVTIGTQVWMAENLKVTHYRDGTTITNVTDDATWTAMTTEAYCIYNNNVSNEVDIYGALYNWFAVNGDIDGNGIKDKEIAPSGWHVPTDAEWNTLEMNWGMSAITAHQASWRGTNEGSILAGGADLWYGESTSIIETNSDFASSGFSALPAGYRSPTSAYYSLMTNAYFWTTTEDNDIGAWRRRFTYNRTDIFRYGHDKRTGFSVRCVRDIEASLPVELHSFSAVSTLSNAITLQWVTESEVENLGFIVQRRHGETDWVEIATYLTHAELQGQGSLTSRTEYSFTDEAVEPNAAYDYRLADVSYEGVKEYHSMTILGVEVTELPREIMMMPAYPNPFNPTTTIRYNLPEQSTVKLTVYDVRGQEVTALQDEVKAPGNYEVQWDGIDDSGNPVSTGVYFARLQAGDYSKTIKMAYLK